ncbi:MAG: ATP-binding protein [candidate division Zixibacteria bacterium]
MLFRSKILIVIFAVGILPAMGILVFSAILLDSTLKRVGAAGLESSFISASSLIDESEAAMASVLRGVLEERIPWDDKDRLTEWMERNRIDIAFRTEAGESIRALIDTIRIDSSSIQAELPLSPGFKHLKIGERLFLSYCLGDSSRLIGCGVLMSADYGKRGRILAEAVSASASLGLYKAFSLKLLGVITVIIVFIALIAGLGISTILSRHLVRPLEKLIIGARRIGAGDLNYRVELAGTDEFSRLAKSFNTMATEIKLHQRRLLEAERLAAWREVARRIAHEIRNPLTPITVELYRLQEMLNKQEISLSEESTKSLGAIRTQIQALQDLSSQFSTFAKEPELRPVRCKIRDIIENAVSLYSHIENASINISIPDDIPQLQLDPQMMGRVFGNLIKNSVEASPDGMTIDISATQKDDMMEMTVRDDGPGFPAEKLEKIDQPYITTKTSGTGLGLAIVKKIVEEHGGKIRFYNDGGAVVKFTLPVGM